jgi:uncharacterized circularly permuted ATP-grasp superfamily protein
VPIPATTVALSEEEQAKQEVIEAAENAWYLFNEAKLDPTNESKVETALAAQTGSARSRVEQIIDQYVRLNQRSRTLESAPARVAVDQTSVLVDLSAGTASLELCHLNSNLLIQSASGADVIVDDQVVAYRTNESYVLVDEIWLKSDGVVLDELEGAYTCDLPG